MCDCQGNRVCLDAGVPPSLEAELVSSYNTVKHAMQKAIKALFTHRLESIDVLKGLFDTIGL